MTKQIDKLMALAQEWAGAEASDVVSGESSAWTKKDAFKAALEVAMKPGETAHRTDQQIVDQTEELAKFLLSWKYGHKPETTSPMRDAIHPKAEDSWEAACHVQEMLTATDVNNAIAEVEYEGA
jgi:hypothetical protein